MIRILTLIAFLFAFSTLAACSSGAASQPPVSSGAQALNTTGGDVSADYEIAAAVPDVLYVNVAGGSVTLRARTTGPGTPVVGTTIIVRDTGSASALKRVIVNPCNGAGGCTETIDGQSSLDLIILPGQRRDIRKKAVGVWTTLGGAH